MSWTLQLNNGLYYGYCKSAYQKRFSSWKEVIIIFKVSYWFFKCHFKNQLHFWEILSLIIKILVKLTKGVAFAFNFIVINGLLFRF